jgi:ATP-dependent Clp protease ATP-binding subunit ClpA
MFERFTESARAAVVAARAESRELGADAIGCEHLLVAVVAAPGEASRAAAQAGLDAPALRRALAGARPPSALDAGALAAIGIDLEAVRRRAEASFGPGALERRRPARGGAMPFTAEAKHALERSVRAAVARGDRAIGAEHVLLGVLDAMEPGGPAAGALAALDVSPERLRELLAPARSA